MGAPIALALVLSGDELQGKLRSVPGRELVAGGRLWAGWVGSIRPNPKPVREAHIQGVHWGAYPTVRARTCPCRWEAPACPKQCLVLNLYDIYSPWHHLFSTCMPDWCCSTRHVANLLLLHFLLICSFMVSKEWSFRCFVTEVGWHIQVSTGLLRQMWRLIPPSLLGIKDWSLAIVLWVFMLLLHLASGTWRLTVWRLSSCTKCFKTWWVGLGMVAMGRLFLRHLHGNYNVCSSPVPQDSIAKSD